MKIENLPSIIAVFPLSNAVFFPKTILPLNIFEKRYISLVEDCMKGERLFGMIQPNINSSNSLQVHKVGCLGKIISFNETDDKRFIITLSGVVRFKVKKEIDTEKLYRKFDVDYKDFIGDLQFDEKKGTVNFDKKNLLNKIRTYFRKKNYSVELDELLKLNLDQLISTVCMISPFSIEEKQKILETIKIQDKLKILEEIINFNLVDAQENKTIQ